MRLYSMAASGEPARDHFEGVFVDLDDKMRITLELPGGSGFGDPGERDPKAIRRDLIEELVSPEGACKEYGWKGGLV